MKRPAILTALALVGALTLAGCSNSPTVTKPGEDKPAASPAAEEKPTAKEGTRENPYPIGSTIEGKEWTVTINSVTLGATDAVLAANQFNQTPPEGSEFILVNYTVTYTGDDADGGIPAIVSVDYVTPEGQTVNKTDVMAVAPEAIDTLSALYNGASVTGNTAIAVPSANAGAGVLAVRADMIGDKVFVAVQ